VERVAAVRAHHKVDDIDLLTSRFTTNQALPEEVRRSAANLHQQFRQIVEKVAERIEDGRYREVEAAVNQLDPSLKQREFGQQLVRADKCMHISYETVRLTVEFFRDLNVGVLNRIESERSSAAGAADRAAAG
jgi:predicted transcriptional regulator